MNGETYGAPGHDHEIERSASRMTAWSLFTLFSVDPCVAVIPLLLAAAPLGDARTILTVLTYEAAMLATTRSMEAPAETQSRAIPATTISRAAPKWT